MTHDPRWNDIAADWLRDSGLSEPRIRLHVTRLAKQLHAAAEEFMSEVVQYETDRLEAAYDAHIDRKIDEARGK